jgi:hypothetical protein
MLMMRSGPGRDAGGVTYWVAALLGIKRTSFQCAPKATTPHYDLTGFERTRAIRLGAVVCNRQQIVIVSRRARANLRAR